MACLYILQNIKALVVRAKLYYLRKLTGKAARFKEIL